MSESNKKIVKEVNDAFSTNSIEGFLTHCSEDVVWRMIGGETVTGIQELREFMSQGEGAEPPRFSVDEMIAEGDSVICRGDMTMKGADGLESRYSYCDAYRFDGGRIAKLDAYIIKLSSEDEKVVSA